MGGGALIPKSKLDPRQPPRATALQGHAHLRELDVAMIKQRINGKYATPNRLQDVPCRVLYSSSATAAQKQALEHYVKVRRGVVEKLSRFFGSYNSHVQHEEGHMAALAAELEAEKAKLPSAVCFPLNDADAAGVVGSEPGPGLRPASQEVLTSQATVSVGGATNVSLMRLVHTAAEQAEEAVAADPREGDTAGEEEAGVEEAEPCEAGAEASAEASAEAEAGQDAEPARNETEAYVHVLN